MACGTVIPSNMIMGGVSSHIGEGLEPFKVFVLFACCADVRTERQRGFHQNVK